MLCDSFECDLTILLDRGADTGAQFVLVEPRIAPNTGVDVLRIDGDELKRVPVDTAISNVTRIEVIKGLQAGDRVALASVFGHELKDGMRVKAD